MSVTLNLLSNYIAFYLKIMFLNKTKKSPLLCLAESKRETKFSVANVGVKKEM